MTHRFIDIPRYIEPVVYENTINKIVDFIKNDPAVSSIYRLGNVNHPGISDLDIIVVFKNESSCILNPNDFFNSDDKYLVTHDIAGASVANFKKILPFTFWDNLQCIWGDDHTKAIPIINRTLDFKKEFQEQIGLEFLIKNFIDLSVQQKYGVIKLRSLLQEIKGVRYDLAFLGIKELPINQLMKDFLLRLDNWFETPFDPKEFSTWLSIYHKELKKTIQTLDREGKLLWLPKEIDLKYGRNIFLNKSGNFTLKSSGIFLPTVLVSRSKRWYNAHQRLNQFKVDINFTTNDDKNIHFQRIKTFEEYKAQNAKHYPHFGALHSSLVDHFI